jgi:hypothetical protein
MATSRVKELQDKIDLAIAANEAGDLASALKWFRSARMMRAGMPSQMLDGVQIMWTVGDIDAAMAEIKQAQAQVVGIHQIKRTFTRTTD